MTHKFTFTIGDWSCDGHKQFDVIHVESSHTLEECQAAYAAASKKLGFDLIKDYCCDFESNSLDDISDELEQLKPLMGDWYESEDFSSIWTDVWFDLIVAMIKSINPEISIEQVNHPNWNVGGYGLFYL